MNHKQRAIHLIEFTVENYRSIREPVTLSMQSTHLHTRSTDFLISTNKKRLLSSVALYGANASGKSNLIRALFLFCNSITGNNLDFNAEKVEPFLLDELSKTKDTTFEAVFEFDSKLYVYGFQYSTASNEITSEWLKATRNKSPRLSMIFERHYGKLEVNSKLILAEHGISRAFSKQLQPRELFITTLSKNSAWTLAKEVVEAWKNCFVINTLVHDPLDSVARMIFTDPTNKELLLPLLQQADMNIADVRVTKNDSDEFVIKLGHIYVNKKSSKLIWFDIREQESAGTLKFFSFALPLLMSLRDGTLMALDELGSTLHPDLLRFVVTLFNDHKRNPQHAQLILTTHDTSLMKGLFARDQIYFTHKPASQITSLYPLSDIRGVRKDLKNLDERYLRGDFGAVPDIIPG